MLNNWGGFFILCVIEVTNYVNEASPMVFILKFILRKRLDFMDTCNIVVVNARYTTLDEFHN